jgi:hypothetical protein
MSGMRKLGKLQNIKKKIETHEEEEEELDFNQELDDSLINENNKVSATITENNAEAFNPFSGDGKTGKIDI